MLWIFVRIALHEAILTDIRNVFLGVNGQKASLLLPLISLRCMLVFFIAANSFNSRILGNKSCRNNEGSLYHII